MGALWFSRAKLSGTVSEMVGYKSGIALDLNQIIEFTSESYREYFIGDMDSAVRVRSEEFEEIIAGLLYGVGNIASPSIAPASIKMFHRLKDRPDELNAYLALLDAMSDRLSARLSTEFEEQTTTPLHTSVYDRVTRPVKMMGQDAFIGFDRKEFAQHAYAKFGETGYSLAASMIQEFNEDLHRSPWTGFREKEFEDVVALSELFASESLRTSSGTFLDQRFIDYLSANVSDLQTMNWRKFEGLVGEYFTREGYHVELGPGRGDDGIDARLWPEKRAEGDPATIIVQCKRQKESISKVIVKSLWADLVAEGAQSGLIVTTSRFSPGAKQTRTVRQYPIELVDGVAVIKWVESMRSPKAGIFLAE